MTKKNKDALHTQALVSADTIQQTSYLHCPIAKVNYILSAHGTTLDLPLVILHTISALACLMTVDDIAQTYRCKHRTAGWSCDLQLTPAIEGLAMQLSQPESFGVNAVDGHQLKHSSAHDHVLHKQYHLRLQ